LLFDLNDEVNRVRKKHNIRRGLELRLIRLLAPSPRSCIPMATYDQSNFEQIATAIGVDVGQIAKHENLFEAAARWYRLDKRRPRRTAPSSLRRKVDQVGKDARRLLMGLGINSPDEAADGPGHTEILDALVLLGEPNEDPVIEGTRRIGRLVEIIGGVAAAAEFERRAKKAATEVTRVGKLTVREGNPGDDAVNNWTDAMMSIYRKITGKEPRTSVGGPNKPNEGIADGPLIRFLQATAEPIKEIHYAEDAWRSRVRTRQS
jgi:hypothetical protein